MKATSSVTAQAIASGLPSSTFVRIRAAATKKIAAHHARDVQAGAQLGVGGAARLCMRQFDGAAGQDPSRGADRVARERRAGKRDERRCREHDANVEVAQDGHGFSGSGDRPRARRRDL